MKIIVVGCGISGISAATLLSRAGHRVEIFETRDHVGGNCYNETIHGVTMHKYGPHLFHTNDGNVWRFLSEFSSFSDYRHRVVADTRLGRISIPYSLKTESQIGRRLEDEEIRNLIFTEYSEKQWGVPWRDLPDTIRNRVPARREDDDDRYFQDRYQGQPIDGFTAMFKNMLDGITVHLGVKADDWRRCNADLLIYCGKIDAYYGYRYGRLPYRSLRFEHEKTAARLPHAVINQCNKKPYTRIYDHAHFSNETPEFTVVTHEFPCTHTGENTPYYPMPFGPGKELYSRYRKLASLDRSRVIMLGRLATYSYLDMWMAIAQAMAKVRPLL